MGALTTEEANELLPKEPTKAPTDARLLKYLFIGPPKWGKTSFGCDVPDSVLLATEEGHMFHETRKIIIDAWDFRLLKDKVVKIDDAGNYHMSMVMAAELICASDMYKFIVIDTADMAAKQCLDYHYDLYGVKHASDAGDWGRGWDLCLSQPFRKIISQFMKSGRGVMFITHTNLVEKKVGNLVQSRWETTLPSQVQKFLHTQADVIIHASFGKKRKGMQERDRIISMDGSNEILAGSRVCGINLPKKFIVDPTGQWKQWNSFFTDPKAVKKADEDYVRLALSGKEAEELAAEPEAATISEPVGEETASQQKVATSQSTKPKPKR